MRSASQASGTPGEPYVTDSKAPLEVASLPSSRMDRHLPWLEHTLAPLGVCGQVAAGSPRGCKRAEWGNAVAQRAAATGTHSARKKRLQSRQSTGSRKGFANMHKRERKKGGGRHGCMPMHHMCGGAQIGKQRRSSPCTAPCPDRTCPAPSTRPTRGGPRSPCKERRTRRSRAGRALGMGWRVNGFAACVAPPSHEHPTGGQNTSNSRFEQSPKVQPSPQVHL